MESAERMRLLRELRQIDQQIAREMGPRAVSAGATRTPFPAGAWISAIVLLAAWFVLPDVAPQVADVPLVPLALVAFGAIMLLFAIIRSIIFLLRGGTPVVQELHDVEDESETVRELQARRAELQRQIDALKHD